MTPFDDGSSTVVNWTIGLGLEAKIAPKSSDKIEYLHADQGNQPSYSNGGILAVTGAAQQNVR